MPAIWTVVTFIQTWLHHKWQTTAKRANKAEQESTPKISSIAALFIYNCGHCDLTAGANDGKWIIVILISKLVVYYGMTGAGGGRANGCGWATKAFW